MPVAASQWKSAKAFRKAEPHTFIPLDGYEKGLPHFIYTKALILKDFKHFKKLSLHKDVGNHWCFLGRLEK